MRPYGAGQRAPAGRYAAGTSFSVMVFCHFSIAGLHSYSCCLKGSFTLSRSQSAFLLPVVQVIIVPAGVLYNNRSDPREVVPYRRAYHSTERGIMQKDRTVSNWDKLPVVLDVHTVALIFDVSDQTVKTWLQTGKLKATKVARKWVIDRDYIRGIVQGGATL